MDKNFRSLTAIVFFTILVLLLSSCINFTSAVIKGDGKIIEKKIDVSKFNYLVFSGTGTVLISQGNEEKLIVEAEENIIDKLKTEVKSDTLFIGMKNNFGGKHILPTRDIIFKLTIKEINGIKLSGAGSIIGEDNIDFKNLDISSSGTGNIRLKISGNNIKSAISGAGRIELDGKVNSQEINISGLGTYNADNMASDDCKIIISGTGNAKVNVIQNLDITISGLGSVEYRGRPLVTQKISGSGNIKSLD